MDVAEAPRDDGLADALRGVLTEIGASRELLTTGTDARLLYRQYSAAALDRACELLRCGLILIEARAVEGVGILARSAWEAWLVGTYLLTGRDEALIRLAADRVRHDDLLAVRNDLAPEVRAKLAGDRSILVEAERHRRQAAGRSDWDEETIAFDRLTVESMAREVGPLLKSGGFDENADVLAVYDLFYRSHSAYDSHGIAAVERHLDTSEGQLLRLNASAAPWIEGERTLAIVGLYVSNLAYHLFEVFGIGVARLERAQEALLSAARDGANQALDEAAELGLPGSWERFR